LIVTLTEAEGNTLKAAVQPPVQIRVVPQAGGTVSWLQNKQVSDAINQWLKDTF
jgi:hypothetical protein